MKGNVREQATDKQTKKLEIMTKSELRVIYLGKQRSLSDAERGKKSRQIAERFFESFELTDIRFLHVYLSLSINNEIITSHIYKQLWREFSEITTVASRINFQTMTLEHPKFSSLSGLFKNKWRILEPTTKELIEIEKLDAVLVPLLCFDEKGFRAGYGKGFYDKFLSECRADCLKIGLSYFAPVAEISDAQDFDVRLDFCLTPEKVFSWQKQ